ncbi:hypothetical protein KSP39_PZI024198 [Platanthera zijinensis]|uniref:Integrase catalytic domain-containing protein n=1 Tax=Platanthera zijinensis TaxID=2320716 RepID=A0AAP0AU33_9ASPA
MLAIKTYKTLILNSLTDEYENFTMSLIHGKEVLKYSEVSTTLLNHKFRRRDKESSKAESAKALVSHRGRSEKKKNWHKKNNNGTQKRDKSCGRSLGRNQCAFCLETCHWKKDCLKLKDKNKGLSLEAETHITQEITSGGESDVSLSVTPQYLLTDDSYWILDTGATYHICHNQEWLCTYKSLDTGVFVMGNDQTYHTIGFESILVRMHGRAVGELTDVRHVPYIRKNLPSVGALKAKGYKYIMAYEIDSCCKGFPPNSFKARIDMIKGAKNCKLDFCGHCVIGKKTRVFIGTAVHNTKGILNYFHTDVCGPTKTKSFIRRQYFVSFIDDYSKYVWVYTMKSKNEVLEIFVIWKKWIENQTDKEIRYIRSDNEDEYTSKAFLQEYQRSDIEHHFTVRETPQQNGVSERMNRTLVEKVRCMLSNAELGRIFWAETIDYACHLMNRFLFAVIGKKTPKEMWLGHPARDYVHIKVFGCPAYYHVKNDKLELQAKKTIFIGFRRGVKCYKLYDQTERKIVISRDVTFDETSLLKPRDSEQAESSKSITTTIQNKEFDVTPFVPLVPPTSDEVDDETAYEISGRKTIECKSVYAKKEGSHGAADVRYTSRLVAKAFAQREEQYGLILEQLDVKTTFFHGDLQEEIYMKQPPEYEAQSDLKYKRSQYDHCAYFKRLDTGEFIYLLSYIDDMLIAASSQSKIDRMKRQLSKQFEMKELGAYIEKVLKRFGIDYTTKAVTLPLTSHFQLSADLCPKDDQERKRMKLVLYASAVDSLMYLMVCIRPYIAQAVGVVSRYMYDPGQGHRQTVKWILRYHKGIVDVGLVYERQQSSALIQTMQVIWIGAGLRSDIYSHWQEVQ